LIPQYTRPSPREISRKIKQAREAVSAGRISSINPASIAADALELSLDVEEIPDVLIELLGEITPGEYVGQSPPQRSYEDEIPQYELFPFKWESKRLGCTVYLKFAFREDWLYLVSLHEHRKETEKE